MARLREFDTNEALRVAVRAFWKQGYQATSIRDLEDATGLTAGSLYKAYGNKRALFLQCLDHYIKEDSYVAILLRMFDTPIRKALRRLLDIIIETAKPESTRPSGCLVTNLVAELLSIDPDLARDASAGLADMQKALRFRFKWAQENGEIASDRDTDALAAHFMVVIQGLLVISTSTRDIETMTSARDVALATLD